MPDQRFIFRWSPQPPGDAGVVEVPVELATPLRRAALDQTVELPAPFAPIRLTEYLPKAALEQNVEPADDKAAPPAVLLAIDGPTQSHQTWLLADDPDRNRLVSLIATWRYMAVKDQAERDNLFRQFETELTRDPKLIVSAAEGKSMQELPLSIGVRQSLDDPKCAIRVRSFYHDYALDDKTKEPVNRSDKRMNPAALVEIEQDGKKEERWLFAKFPAFQKREEGGIPVKVILDCPLEQKRPGPDYALVTIGRARHEVWAREEDECSSKRIEPEQRVEVAGSPYTFRIIQFVPSGRLIESYRPAESGRGLPALRIEAPGASGERAPLWLGDGKSRTLRTPTGAVTVSFGRAPGMAHGAHPSPRSPAGRG